jgi:hypothetical protein
MRERSVSDFPFSTGSPDEGQEAKHIETISRSRFFDASYQFDQQAHSVQHSRIKE